MNSECVLPPNPLTFPFVGDVIWSREKEEDKGTNSSGRWMVTIDNRYLHPISVRPNTVWNYYLGSDP